MKTRTLSFLCLIIIITSCQLKPTLAEQLDKSFMNISDSLESEGYIFHQPITPEFYPRSISENKIEGNLDYSYRTIGDTTFTPKSLQIEGRKFKKGNLFIEYYQFYFEDENEEKEFNQFIPFSQFLLANSKTRGTYFMDKTILYLEYHPFP